MSQETKHSSSSSSSFGLWLPAMASAAAASVARMVNEAVSLLVFIVLDLLDALLCFVYKMADYVMEEECKPCYCSSSSDDDDDVILVAENGGSKLLSLTSSASFDDTKLHLEDISDTLFLRPCLLADLAKTALHDLRKLKLVSSAASSSSSSAASSSAAATFTTNSTIVRVLRGKVGRARGKAAARTSSRSWTDCACESCNHWSSPSGERDALFVHVEGPKGIAIYN